MGINCAYEDLEIDKQIIGEEIFIKKELPKDFAEASLDYNPLHLDPSWMDKTNFGKTKFKGVIVHGMFTFSIITKMITDWLLPIGGIHRRLETRWLKPIYPGDTITPQAVIFAKKKTIKGNWVLLKVRVTRQDGEVVAEGESMEEFPNNQ
jgi:acyl dehydratase